MSICQLNLKQH